MSKCIVLLSGGLDSTTCATMAVQEFGAENVIALSLGYGQKHVVELEHAKQVVSALSISKHVIKELPPVFAGSKSTLIESENRENPDMSYEDQQLISEVISTAVPFRNAHFLSVATTLAMIERAEWIYYGAHAGDARNWVYADCTPEFNGAMANAIFVGTYMKVRLVVPLQYMTKVDVVKKALKINAPLHLTRSCYNAGEVSCGTCATCQDRLDAFRNAGTADQIPYRSTRAEC